ncbi:hypothetical protein HELRODRAFT_172188 [Helobdella robusta]|uniref:Tetratricopeptide repeat protein n=1 Tax=Helobdella robusta TaxID=6412 RepID=T1F549_HELRO|nr:hypothetical protein HELRODRAFT_172188 [Helobdella robusta]ESO04537.1 hypothetical protein HELRODRAFT_172188 [Helobdella robusta]
MKEKDAIQILESKLKTERKEGNAKSYYYAGLLLMMLRKPDKAREYIDRSIKMNLCYLDKQIFALKGWLDLNHPDMAVSKKSHLFFDRSLGVEGKQHPDAILGKVKYIQLHNNNSTNNTNKKTSADDEILELINQLIVTYGQYLPGLIEKMRQNMLTKNWEQVLDNAQRDLYEKSPSIETGVLLGDAYMEVQQPDKAIESYEVSIKKNPKDPVLANKIGQALVKTHQYGRAIIYYEASLKQSGQHTLR